MLGLIGRWLSLSYYYPISTTFGMLIAPIGFWGYNKIHQNHPNAEVLKVTLVKVKVVGVVMSFIISMGFIITISAQIPPTVPDDLSLYHSTRVITFNILNKNSNKFEPANYWENRKIHVANHLGTLDPDIFGVQEAYFEQLEYLNQTLNNRSYNWTGVGRDDGVIAGEFSAIFYDMEKYNLLDHGTFWLSDTPDIPSRFPQDHNRICSWVHLQFIDDHSEFFVFNTHYGFSTELQIKSSILINQRVVDMTADFPVIVMGDFNMMNVYPHYMFMEAFGVKPLNDAYRLMHRFVNPLEATSAPTFKIKTDIGFHIDHFFISEDIIPATVDIIKESYDGVRTYSDHYPVKMDCYIPRKNG
jgi:endonuclease/exonuclease/phosphatase family metal-dependent hydrolase